MPQISILETTDYERETVRGAVARHFSLLNVTDIRPGMRVLVKPNLIMRSAPARAAVTHPALVEAVVQQLQAMGVTDIVIADSPGGLYTPQLLAAAYETTGYAAVARRCGVVCNTDCGARETAFAAGKCYRTFTLIEPALSADYIVNLCKVKTHGMMTFTGGAKNLFGLVPGLLKPALHYRYPDKAQFAEMLLDLSLLVKPGLTIADAVDTMEGDGPTGGTPRHLGFTAAAKGKNIYSLDLVLGEMLGLCAAQVPLTAAAVRRKLCPERADEVELLGDADAVKRLSAPDFRKPAAVQLNFSGNVPRVFVPAVNWLTPRLAPHPRIRARDCIGCGKCAESCPAHTIVLTGGKARVVLRACIHCYCCHEMCPVQAIDLKAPAVFGFLSGRNSKKG